MKKGITVLFLFSSILSAGCDLVDEKDSGTAGITVPTSETIIIDHTCTDTGLLSDSDTAQAAAMNL